MAFSFAALSMTFSSATFSTTSSFATLPMTSFATLSMTSSFATLSMTSSIIPVSSSEHVSSIASTFLATLSDVSFLLSLLLHQSEEDGSTWPCRQFFKPAVFAAPSFPRHSNSIGFKNVDKDKEFCTISRLLLVSPIALVTASLMILIESQADSLEATFTEFVSL